MTQAAEYGTGLTRALAQACAEHNSTAADTECARVALLDTLGCILHSYDQSATVRSFVRESGFDLDARRIHELPSGHFARSHAALLLGLAAHACDYDDYDVRSGGHPGAVIIPAAIASLPRNVSGRRLIDAIAVGYAVMIWLGSQLRHECYRRGLHATGVFGAVAAAAAVGRLGALSVDKLATTLGLAAAQASGLRAQFGSSGKPLQAGHAAMAATLAASEAAAGLTSCPDALGSPGGFVEMLVGPDDTERAVVALRTGLERDFGHYQQQSRPSVKLNPSCGSAQAPYECGVQLRNRVDAARLPEISRITITLPQQTLQTLFHHAPADPDERRFSAEYAVAVGLCGASPSSAYGPGFDVPRLIPILMERCQVVGDADLQALRLAGGLPARVVVAFGRESYVESVDFPLGSPQRPAPWDAVVTKFLQNAVPVIGRDRADAVVADVTRAEELPRLDTLIAAVIAPAAAWSAP
jgi:2-methylcitrate dehydratase PrpD